jgi:hypothetical protein
MAPVEAEKQQKTDEELSSACATADGYKYAHYKVCAVV